MQKITPFLWFDSQAEEAVAFYLSVFKDGKIHTKTRTRRMGRGRPTR
ncbi:MAG: VOC family protein [Chthoniobacterales bacterium]